MYHNLNKSPSKNYFIALLTFLLCIVSNQLHGQDWLSGYEYRKPVTINSGDISGAGTLTDFPVLVSITSTDLNTTTAHVTSANGYDIEFTDSNSTTEIPHQLVSYDGASGTIVAWVKLDLDGTNGNTFYIYYGNSSITTDQSSNSTWNNSYLGVWTLDETTSTTGATYSDLTSNSNDLTDNGGTTNITGKIGNAQNFDGTNDWLQVDDNASLRNLTDEFTFSAWVQLDGDQASDVGIIIKNIDGDYFQHLGVEDNEKPSFRVQTNGNTTQRTNNNIDVDLDDGDWHHLVGVYDGTDMIFYVDGAEEDNVAKGNAGNVDTNSEPLLMGRRAIGDDRFYDGDIDEPRYLNAALTADWVGTEFTNQDDPASFVSGGTEESTTPVFGGTATAANDEIFSGNTTSITLSDFTASGTTLQWQSSADGITFSDVMVGSGTASVVYTTGTLTSTTYFRCLVDNGSNTVASTIAVVTIQEEFTSGTGPTGYSLRRKLTIESDEVINANTSVASHSDFPLLVRLTGTKAVSDLIYARNGGDVAHISGYDIIFTESDGSTEIDHQIEHYNPTTGDYVAWLDIAALSTTVDTEIYMYYGNASVTTDPSEDIFDTNYVGTWHLHNEYKDAVSTGNDGIGFGNVENDAGIIADGARFSPVDDDDFSRIEIGTFDPDPTSITISTWFNRDVANNGPDDGRLISKSDGQAANDHVFMFSLNNNDDIRFRLTGTEADDSGAETLTQTQNINFNPGDWVYAAFTYTANGSVIVYENGVEVNSYNQLNDREKIEQNTGFRVAMGNNPGPADGGDPTRRKPFDGVIDEMRVASIVRSSDWLLTEYNNQRENSTFCTIGNEEGCDVSGGTISVVDENIFSGEQTTLTAVSTSGTLQWQSSTDNTTYTDISGATAASYTTIALTETTYFRVVATSGTCTDVSNIIIVNVQGRFLSNYAYRKSITIDKSKVAGTTPHVDFPLLVSITDNDLRTTANGGNVYDTDNGNGTLGDDITFTDASGNELTQYREEYDETSGKLVVWVKIPSLSATQDTEIFLYYGNCTGSGLSNLFNTNTWVNDTDANDYDAVWLMNDSPTTTITDATANNRDGTGTGLTASTNGQISGAIDLEDGDTSDKMTFSSYTSSGDELTVSAWVNAESLLNPNQGADTDDAIIVSHTDFELKTLVKNLGPDENQFSFEVTTTGGAVAAETLPSDLAAGTFIMVTGVYDGSNVLIYENGNVIQSSAQTGNLNGSSSDVLIGNNAGNTLAFDGLIDHVTILPGARSADWITTMYNNQTDPNSFYNYNSGVEESQVSWIGGATGAETDFNDPDNWSNCQVPTSTESIVLTNGASFYPALTQNTQLDDLIIETGTSFDLGGFELTLTGRLTNNGTFTHNNGEVIFAGTSEQQISGSSSVSLYDLTINNSSNEVRIETATTIENTVTLTSGFITISDNTFTITSNGEIAGGSASSFFIMEGTQCLEQEDIGATARSGNILFPIGTSSSSYTPVTINNIGTDDDFCIRVADNAYSGGDIGSGSQFTSNQLDKTWFIEETVDGGSDITLTLQWNGVDELVGFDRTDMFISHFTGGSYQQYESGITATNPSANVYAASTSGVSSFSPVTGGSGNGPLPVELVDFNAQIKGTNILLSWATLTEINNDHYTVFKSKDGISFSEAGKINGAGNSSEKLTYVWIDTQPSLGPNYYYLRQTDFDGTFKDYQVELIQYEITSNLNESLTVYPNPSNGDFNITAQGFGSGQKVVVSIINITGKEVFKRIEKADVKGNITASILFDQNTGIYFIKLSNSNQSIQRRILIRKK